MIWLGNRDNASLPSGRLEEWGYVCFVLVGIVGSCVMGSWGIHVWWAGEDPRSEVGLGWWRVTCRVLFPGIHMIMFGYLLKLFYALMGLDTIVRDLFTHELPTIFLSVLALCVSAFLYGMLRWFLHSLVLFLGRVVILGCFSMVFFGFWVWYVRDFVDGKALKHLVSGGGGNGEVILLGQSGSVLGVSALVLVGSPVRFVSYCLVGCAAWCWVVGEVFRWEIVQGFHGTYVIEEFLLPVGILWGFVVGLTRGDGSLEGFVKKLPGAVPAPGAQPAAVYENQGRIRVPEGAFLLSMFTPIGYLPLLTRWISPTTLVLVACILCLIVGTVAAYVSNLRPVTLQKLAWFNVCFLAAFVCCSWIASVCGISPFSLLFGLALLLNLGVVIVTFGDGLKSIGKKLVWTSRALLGALYRRGYEFVWKRKPVADCYRLLFSEKDRDRLEKLLELDTPENPLFESRRIRSGSGEVNFCVWKNILPSEIETAEMEAEALVIEEEEDLRLDRNTLTRMLMGDDDAIPEDDSLFDYYVLFRDYLKLIPHSYVVARAIRRLDTESVIKVAGKTIQRYCTDDFDSSPPLLCACLNCLCERREEITGNEELSLLSERNRVSSRTSFHCRATVLHEPEFAFHPDIYLDTSLHRLFLLHNRALLKNPPDSCATLETISGEHVRVPLEVLATKSDCFSMMLGGWCEVADARRKAIIFHEPLDLRGVRGLVEFFCTGSVQKPTLPLLVALWAQGHKFSEKRLMGYCENEIDRLWVSLKRRQPSAIVEDLLRDCLHHLALLDTGQRIFRFRVGETLNALLEQSTNDDSLARLLVEVIITLSTLVSEVSRTNVELPMEKDEVLSRLGLTIEKLKELGKLSSVSTAIKRTYLGEKYAQDREDDWASVV